MNHIIKYRAPLFSGRLPFWTLRVLRYDSEGKSTGLDYDMYGRTLMVSGPTAPEAVEALIKAFGGSSQVIT